VGASGHFSTATRKTGRRRLHGALPRQGTHAPIAQVRPLESLPAKAQTDATRSSVFESATTLKMKQSSTTSGGQAKTPRFRRNELQNESTPRSQWPATTANAGSMRPIGWLNDFSLGTPRVMGSNNVSLQHSSDYANRRRSLANDYARSETVGTGLARNLFPTWRSSRDHLCLFATARGLTARSAQICILGPYRSERYPEGAEPRPVGLRGPDRSQMGLSCWAQD